jgi:hypothetical protein
LHRPAGTLTYNLIAPITATTCNAMKSIRIGRHEIALPASRLWRMALGVGLILAGILGFLPVLGFWMIPLGLLVLSVDLMIVRRFRRRAGVWLGRKLKRRFPGLWKRLN